MAKGKYINSKNLFLDDDDTDDVGDNQKQLHKLEQKTNTVKNNILSSTQRTLSCLDKTEQIGIGTSVALAIQGEQLEGIDNKLDKMDNVLTSTKNSLNGMKSMFSGVNNYFSKSKNPVNEKYESRKDTEPTQTSTQHNCNVMPHSTTIHHEGNKTKSSNDQFEEKFEENLQQMSQYLERLQKMGQDIGVELDSQNKLLNVIKVKVDRNDSKIIEQNKDMNRLLGKK